MSTTIDEKVVEMRFDNQNFEKNVSTTLSTLDKLKQSLNFDKLSDALYPVESAVESVSDSFSALEIAGITALVNLTNKAVDAGIELVKSLSVDQIAAGWQKFADKTTAVGTLMSQGFSMEEVTEQLEKLQFYTDETSYNFVDMVSTIGKFTASGQGLEESTTALMGIANWAAMSGQNATTASRAMYQLAQAMSKGALKYDDYKSIQNANMDTLEFRMQAATAAEELGILKKQADGTYKLMYELADGTVEASDSFYTLNELFTSDLLTRQQWLDSDVMMQVFSGYSSAVDKIKEYVDANDVTASEAIEALSGQLDDFAIKAFKAAQEARTYEDAVNSIKDAVSSGFTRVFELIFGDYEEATKLWTDLANNGYDAFVEPINSLGDLLEGGLSSGWKQFTKEINLGSEATTHFKEVVQNVAVGHNEAVAGMISEAGSFSESLQEGWLTADILEESLNSLIDEYSALSDEERKNTGITDANWEAIQKVREQLQEGSLDLSEWSDEIAKLSGRQNLIQSFWNVWDALGEVIGHVKEAFHDVFPEATGEQIYELTVRIREFTEKLFLNEEQTAKLQKIVEGLSHALNLGKRAIDAVVKGLKPLIGVFKSITGSGTDAIASIAGFFTNLDESEKTAQFFENVTKRISEVLTFLIGIFNSASSAIKSVVGWFKDLAAAFSNGSDEASETEAPFERELSLFERVVLIIQTVLDRFSTLIDYIANHTSILELLTKVVGGLGDAFTKSNTFGNGFLDCITSFLKALSDHVPDFVQIGFDIVQAIADGIRDNIGEIITTLLEAAQNAIQAIIDEAPDLIGKVSTLITTVLDGLQEYIPEIVSSVVGVINTVLDTLSEKLPDMLDHIIHFVVTIVNGLTTALEENSEELNKAVETLISGLLTVAMVSLFSGPTSFSDLLDGLASSLEAFALKTKADALKSVAIAIALLAASLFILSKIDESKLTNTISAMSLALGELVGALAIISGMGTGQEGAKNTKSMATSILLVSVALLIMVSAIKKLSDISFGEVMTGLVGIAGVLLAVVLALRTMPDDTLSKAASLTIISLALNLMASAIKTIGSLSLEQLGIGILGLAAALTVIIAALNFLPDNILSKAASLTIISLALNLMADAISSLSGLSLADVGIALLGIAGAIAAVVIALQLMPDNAIAQAGTLVIVSMALIILAQALTTLGGMSLAQVGIALLAIAGAFTVLGLAALILEPVIPSMILLAGAVALLGIGALTAGTGVLLFAAGLQTLSVAGGSAIAVIILALMGVINLIPFFVTKVCEGILSIIVFIGNSAEAVGEAFLKIVEAIAKIIGEAVPILAEGVAQGILGILQVLDEYFPDIFNAGMRLIIEFLNGIAANIGDVVTAMVDILIDMLEAIAEKLPDIINAGIDIVVGFIDGLALGIEENKEEIKQAFLDLMIAILDLILEFFGIHSPSTVFADVGTNLIEGLINGISDMISSAKEKITELAEGILGKIKEKYEEFKTKGKEAIDKFITGVSSKFADIKSKAGELIDNFKEGISAKWDEIKEVGSNLISGLKSGIEEAKSKLTLAASKAADWVTDTFTTKWDINSPSKVAESIGGYYILGLGKGIQEDAGTVIDATTFVGNKALAALSSSLSGMEDLGDVDITPVITPVIDLDNVSKGASAINDLLSGSRSIDLAASTKLSADRQISKIQNGISVDNTSVVSAISELNDDVNSLKAVIGKLNIVLDTGALVGAMVDPMDSALGRKATLIRRGI